MTLFSKKIKIHDDLLLIQWIQTWVLHIKILHFVLYQNLQIISLKKISLHKNQFSKVKNFWQTTVVYSLTQSILKTNAGISEVIIFMSNYEWRLLWLHWKDKERLGLKEWDGLVLLGSISSNWNDNDRRKSVFI